MNKIIKFGSTWCKPCEVVDKILKEIVLETDIEVEFIDVDEEIDLVNQHNIRNIPTLIYYKSGEKINKTVGIIDKNNILKMFE